MSMPPDLLVVLPVAEVLAGSPVSLGDVVLVLGLIVTAGGWVGQSMLSRHRISELEKGLGRNANEGVRSEIAELRRLREADLQRKLDRQRELTPVHGLPVVPPTRSGIWSPVDDDDDE